MSTNYYRIPTEEEIEERIYNLEMSIKRLEYTPKDIERGFCVIPSGELQYMTPWDKFVENTNVHLGKRSGGWKFVWNFHNNKFYTNKDELFKFIRSGRVVDEYGELIDNEEFIEMALDWCQPDGLVYDRDYYDREKPKAYFRYIDPTYFAKIIDGLVVSGSTEFC